MNPSPEDRVVTPPAGHAPAGEIGLRFRNVGKRYRLGKASSRLRDEMPKLLGRLIGRRSGEPIDQGPDEVWALRDVSFELRRGQALGILGPNGAGKTTILKLLSYITRPTEGHIDVGGRVSALIQLGAGFHPDLSGHENLFLNASILGLSQRQTRQRFDRIVEFAGIDGFLDTPVKRYSSGMYVRLAFAVAAHVDPDILLVDEVLAVGDVSFQRKCFERIKQLRAGGTTIVFVSHNTNMVRAICDTGLFLLEGKVQAAGTALECIRQYEQYVRGRDRHAAVRLHRNHTPLARGEAAVEVTQVATLGADGGVCDAFRYDEPMLVRVGYRAESCVTSPIISLRVLRSDGVSCALVRSDDQPTRTPDLSGEGQWVVRFDPLQLDAGTYLVQVQVNDDGDVVTLGSGQSDWFCVTGPGVTVEHEDGGCFVPNTAWLFPGAGPSTIHPGEGDRVFATG